MMSINSKTYLRIAWQSALAATIFLGLPAGLLLWLILFRAGSASTAADPLIDLLQANGLNKIILLLICSLGWSYALGKISGYGSIWQIGLATLIGIISAWFSPLANLDGWISNELPVHTLYAITLCGLVFSTTSCVGLMYGVLLRNLKATIMLSLTTGVITALTMFISIFVFDQIGIRVGGDVPFAMSKVTAPSLALASASGGMVLGVLFSWFGRNKTVT